MYGYGIKHCQVLKSCSSFEGGFNKFQICGTGGVGS